jgi:nucleoside-diphosphate-sugar epimerase
MDAVIHMAAIPSAERSITDPVATTEVNINGTVNVLEAARYEKVKRVVFASSSAVYGRNPKVPKHEGMIPDPHTPYAVAKLAGEKFCRVYGEIYGLETVALRFFNVFGPRQPACSHYSKVVPRFIKNILNNQSPVIFGDGTQSRDFTYICNAVEATILAATAGTIKGGEVFNVGSNGQLTINDLVKHINRFLGKDIKPVYEPVRNGEIKHSFAYIELIKEKLGYEPGVDLLTGLEQTISAYANVTENDKAPGKHQAPNNK